MIKVGDTVRYVGQCYAHNGRVGGEVVSVSHGGCVVNVKWPGLYGTANHPPTTLMVTKQASAKCQDKTSTDDGVQNPSHYQVFDGVESIEIIARSMTVSEFRGFCLGNVLKYRLRAGKKSELATMEKDLKKAEKYKELFEQHKGKCYDAE